MALVSIPLNGRVNFRTDLLDHRDELTIRRSAAEIRSSNSSRRKQEALPQVVTRKRVSGLKALPLAPMSRGTASVGKHYQP